MIVNICKCVEEMLLFLLCFCLRDTSGHSEEKLDILLMFTGSHSVKGMIDGP